MKFYCGSISLNTIVQVSVLPHTRGRKENTFVIHLQESGTGIPFGNGMDSSDEQLTVEAFQRITKSVQLSAQTPGNMMQWVKLITMKANRARGGDGTRATPAVRPSSAYSSCRPRPPNSADVVSALSRDLCSLERLSDNGDLANRFGTNTCAPAPPAPPSHDSAFAQSIFDITVPPSNDQDATTTSALVSAFQALNRMCDSDTMASDETPTEARSERNRHLCESEFSVPSVTDEYEIEVGSLDAGPLHTSSLRKHARERAGACESVSMEKASSDTVKINNIRASPILRPLAWSPVTVTQEIKEMTEEPEEPKAPQEDGDGTRSAKVDSPCSSCSMDREDSICSAKMMLEESLRQHPYSLQGSSPLRSVERTAPAGMAERDEAQVPLERPRARRSTGEMDLEQDVPGRWSDTQLVDSLEAELGRYADSGQDVPTACETGGRHRVRDNNLCNRVHSPHTHGVQHTDNHFDSPGSDSLDAFLTKNSSEDSADGESAASTPCYQNYKNRRRYTSPVSISVTSNEDSLRHLTKAHMYPNTPHTSDLVHPYKRKHTSFEDAVASFSPGSEHTETMAFEYEEDDAPLLVLPEQQTVLCHTASSSPEQSRSIPPSWEDHGLSWRNVSSRSVSTASSAGDRASIESTMCFSFPFIPSPWTSHNSSRRQSIAE